jgi:hypothetical protein
LRLYNPGAGRVTGNVICRSFWQGKFSANGRDWQVGRIDTESRSFGLANKGYLLLRPWEERNRPIEFQNGMLDAFEFAPNLFFGGEAYKLDCTWIDQQGEPKYQLSFQPTNCALGELKLTGKFIHRLVLTASRGGRPLDRLNAVLDNPQESVRIPAGDYEYLHVQLRSGSTQAYRERYVNFAKRQRLTVGATTGDSAATLAAGGPLTNSVSVTRQGRSLSLRYQLLGADGVPYVIAGVVNRSNPPRFVVSKDGKQIHSGRFEFG